MCAFFFMLFPPSIIDIAIFYSWMPFLLFSYLNAAKVFASKKRAST